MVRQTAFILTLLLACNQAPGGPEPNAKAAKVHRVLVKRPSPGYLFDRFTDAWLDTDSYEHLESFLQARSSDPGTSADRLLLAYFYSKQRENLDALEQFQLALALDPGNAEAWLEKTKLESPASSSPKLKTTSPRLPKPIRKRISASRLRNCKANFILDSINLKKR